MKRILFQESSKFLRWSVTQTSSLNHQTRKFSTKDAIERRSHLFTLEKKRQHEAVGRIEKIEVRYLGVPNDATLIMNKDISTPFDCARHLGELHWKRSALALLDGTVYSDMHKPISNSCTLELQHYLIAEPQQVNRAFWRTCSFILGAIVSQAFKENRVNVKLHSFPGPDVRSGSFLYDVDLDGLPDWEPTKQELYCLSAEFTKLARKELLIEKLDISKELALEMFKDNEYKTAQIPNIAERNQGNITVYRLEDHLDISKGPMVPHTGQVGRVTVTAVHPITAPENEKPSKLYRFQGVALPTGITIKHFVYSNILEERAKKLNSSRTPWEPFDQTFNPPEKQEIAA